MIKPEKKQALDAQMKELGILESDITEKFILGSGKGGQKVQKTKSAVYLKHLPSGIEVKCQKDRTREANRFFARRELVEKFLKKTSPVKTAKEQKIEKLKKQKKRRKRKAVLKTENSNED